MSFRTVTIFATTLLVAALKAAPPQADANAGKYDIVGIKLGTPLKEAMATLRSHNPSLQLKPDSLRYPGSAELLTYGVNAVGAGEGFYFLITMPPNEVVVSKITWVTNLSNSPPKQDAIVASLRQKYGPVSFDTLPASLSLGSRELFWVDDAQGNRLRGDAFNKCRGQSTFFMNGSAPGSRTQYNPTNVRLPSLNAQVRVDEGYANRFDRDGEECGNYTTVRARLFESRLMGVRVPNLVGYLVVMIASGPLDRRATNATHEYMLQHGRIGAPAQKAGVGRSRPKK